MPPISDPDFGAEFWQLQPPSLMTQVAAIPGLPAEYQLVAAAFDTNVQAVCAILSLVEAARFRHDGREVCIVSWNFELYSAFFNAGCNPDMPTMPASAATTGMELCIVVNPPLRAPTCRS